MGDDFPNLFARHRCPSMFSLGQCIIISLASTIYLAGAAFLLAGRPVLPDRMSEGRKPRSTVVEGIPYFYPIVKQDRESTVLAGTSVPVEEGPARASRDGSHTGPWVVGHENKRVDVGLLREPLCLN